MRGKIIFIVHQVEWISLWAACNPWESVRNTSGNIRLCVRKPRDEDEKFKRNRRSLDWKLHIGERIAAPFYYSCLFLPCLSDYPSNDLLNNFTPFGPRLWILLAPFCWKDSPRAYSRYVTRDTFLFDLPRDSILGWRWAPFYESANLVFDGNRYWKNWYIGHSRYYQSMFLS